MPPGKGEPGTRETTRVSNESAATKDGKNATRTQPENEREEGRKDTNGAPTARAQGTTQETNGAGRETEETDMKNPRKETQQGL